MKFKKDKKKSFGWFGTLNPDAGNVELNNKIFNNSTNVTNNSNNSSTSNSSNISSGASGIGEDINSNTKNSIEVEVKSGINGDGFKVTVKDTDGHIIEQEDFSYGYNASYSRIRADKDKPFVTDIINSYLSKYNLSKDDLILTKGKNTFKDKDISDEVIARFRSKYLSESLTDDIDDKLLKIDTLYRDAIDYGIDPESLDKILYSNGADPDAPTFDIGLNVDKAYEELSNFLKKKYQPQFDRDYDDNNIPYNSYNILGFNKLAYKLELERLNKEISNLKDKYNINENLINKKSFKESKFSLTTDEAGSLLTDAAAYAEQFAKNARKLVADLDTGKITTIPWGSQVEADFSDIRDRMEKIYNSNIMKESLSKEMNENWKNFVFIVKCNDGPKELVRVIAEDRFKAEEYAKKMYAQNHTTYADDRYNEWYIEDSDHLNETLYDIKESEEDGLENAAQEYTSANTSINSAKLPAIFSMVNFKPETINLDYGGGKFDNATTALEGKGVTNLVYDPYNRSSGHNKDVIDTVRKNGGADTVTCSNVLNVIKEPEARKAVIKNIYSLLKNSGTAYFTVYEGTGKGNEGPTKSGYQLNKKTGDYVEEISSVFPSVSRRGKLIIASKGTSVTEEFDDDWSDTLETGGEPTYCPDCVVKFVRDEEGDAICPKCNKTPYQLANERRKNESLNENDTKYTATGRKKMVSDEIMSLAVEAARTIDPNAKRDYDDDFIYGDDGHGGSTWVILLDGDGKAYNTWGRNAVLTSKVEKAVNDAADAYWDKFFEDDSLTESKEDIQYGVHSFSQSSIIFRGTEEECAEFIADHNLWDDAEIYAMTPDDPHYLKEAEEKLTTYYQIWAKGPSDSKFHFQDEYAYLSDLIEEAKGFMQGDTQVRVLEVEEDESGNIVKRNGEVLFYSDSAVQTIDKELFDVATPQETADMFGKKVYSKKEDKLYTPTGPVFEAAKLSPEEKLEKELEKLDKQASRLEAKSERCFEKGNEESGWYWKEQADEIRRQMDMMLVTANLKEDYTPVDSFYAIEFDDEYEDNLSRKEVREKALDIIKNNKAESIYVTKTSIYDQNGRQVKDFDDILEMYRDGEKWDIILDKLSISQLADLETTEKDLTEDVDDEVELEYDDLELEIYIGNSNGYFDVNYGNWLPDDRSKTVNIAYTYKVPQADVEEFLYDFIEADIPQEELSKHIDDYDEFLEAYMKEHFDELFEKHKDKILDHFEEDAIDEASENYEDDDYDYED